ncbi:uncharacterized protein TRAVEDRAFT_132392 [Trametes versicolor FP-101664 SS1]|uniref:uncharacterized protein n=1 Tax=Trametes versicolor (strain FP-101664) TaxID=717944 RepID=UPI0004621AC6|nr:uncharacterized protein TRAVEDRAFT_132392 [Trametes versicolor FP-101664 SS1]EIW54174.1 hypothetical protein TRAVEDRAFT_132392 [Trametes versicolor FP-101664 SS1]
MESTSSFLTHISTGKHALPRLPYFLHTLYLFTKSDIKTVVIPVTSLAIASAPLASPLHLPHVVFWLWLHVLQIDLANQSMDPDEDAKNKSYRPIPAKRISVAQTRLLRWAIVPVCLRLSALYSAQTLYASAAFALLTLIYNEFAAHRRHWIIRNVMNALGLAAFEVGATLIASADPTRLDGIALCSVLVSTAIFATTIHAQDFQDVDGDLTIGRRTIPIIFGDAARWTVIVPLVIWSVGLSVFWGLSVPVSAAVTMLAVCVCVLYLCARTAREYQVAYFWYNIWLSTAHFLPAYCRLFSEPYYVLGP